MRAVAAVFRKEVLDHLRDRRTLLSALLFAPLFGPILFAVVMSMSLKSQISEADEALELPVIGVERAPNLIDFLTRNNVDVAAIDGDAEALVKEGTHPVVVVIPEDYPELFREGRPAPVQIVADRSNVQERRNSARVEALLNGYSRKISVLRLQARGVSPTVITPLTLQDIDVSTRTGRSIIILGMVTYFILFAALMGGMPLAIDSTAGERDRNSLESLLSLPVGRRRLMGGKILATALFMLTSVTIAISAFHFGIKLVPFERLDMTANFSPWVGLRVLLVLIPFVLFGAGLMMIVATFTKTHKEAQTYLSVLLAVPTLPIIFASVLGLRPSAALMAVPSLGQHLAITSIMKDEPVQLSWFLMSALSTALLGALLCYLAMRRYEREAILL